MAFTPVNDGDLAVASQLQQVIDALQGVAGAGQAISLTSLDNADDHALTVANLGDGGLGLLVNSSAGAALLDVRDAYSSFHSGVLYVDHVNNRIGINDTSPSVALDVTGSVAVSGALTVGTFAASELAASSLTLDQIATPSAPASGTSVYSKADGGLYIRAAAGSEVALLDASDLSTFNWFNVRDYGAVGNGVTDDTTAIEDAYTALVAAYTASGAAGVGGVLYFPPGNYLHANLSFTGAAPFAMVGEGPEVSRLVSATTTGDAITVGTSGGTAGTDGPVTFSLTNISVTPNNNRDAGTALVVVNSATRAFVSKVYIGNRGGGLFTFDGVNEVLMSDVDGVSSNGTTGDCCLRLIASQGNFHGCKFATAGGNIGRAPTVWISGAAVTTSRFVDCIFGGWGPHLSQAITSIASDAAKFTVTATAHGRVVGDLIVLRGVTGTGASTYNDQWRVATVPTADTFTVTTTANPGTPTVTGATLESPAASFVAENGDGPCNEGVIANCLTTNQAPAPYGSVGFHFDGKRSASHALEGWVLSGNWYDGGRTGLLISGRVTGASTPTTYGFTVQGGEFSQITRSIHLDQVRGVMISGVQCGATGGTLPDDDPVSASCGILVYAGAGSTFTSGVTIADSHLGWPRDFTVAPGGALMTYGILLDGASMDALVVTGNQIAGATAPIGTVNSPVANTCRWEIAGNHCGSGTLPIAANTIIPTVASAASIAAPVGYDRIIVSGATPVATITNAWLGRTVELLFSSANQIITGGNVALAATRYFQAGESVRLTFEGSSWYVTGGLKSLVASDLAAGAVTALKTPYAAAADLHSGKALTAGVWDDYIPSTYFSFSVADASSTVAVTVRAGAAITSTTASANVATRLQIDSTTNYKLGGNIVPSAGVFVSPFAGMGTLYLTGLSVGSHTIRVQVVCNAGTITSHLRASANAPYEFLEVDVLEIKR